MSETATIRSHFNNLWLTFAGEGDAMKPLALLAAALLAVPLRATTPEPPPASDALVETFLSIFPRTAGLDSSNGPA